MAARSGMTTLLNELRTRGDAGTADYVAGGLTFWTDDQLQAILDRNRADIRRERLWVEAEPSGGSAVYLDYRFSQAWPEEAASGTAVWRVEDSGGSTVGTALYTVEYGARSLRFSADTGGTAYYLSYRTFDLDRSAAEVWEAKAASVAARFDLKTDNHELKRSQLYQQYRSMALTFRRQAGAQSATRVRADVDDGGGPRRESW